MWCWKRLLIVLWPARRPNQSILEEISSEYSLEGLMLMLNSNTLATWWEEPTHWKRPWCWETLRAGEGGNREWDGWMASLTQWTCIWANSQRQRSTEKSGLQQAWPAAVHGVTKSRTRLRDWTTTHSSILAWKILWTEDPGWLQSMGSQKSWTRLSNQATTPLKEIC